MSNQIIYRHKNFGIYDLESMRVLEGVYAYNFAKLASVDNEKAFLIKTGRKPNQSEMEYQERLLGGEHAPHNAYLFNWYAYSVQNVLIEHPILVPDTNEIRRISENTFGHKLEENHIHAVCKLVRKKVYDLQTGFFGVNVWQIMGVVASLDSFKIDKNDSSISLLFNKIYKRKPSSAEINLCQKLVLTTPEDIQNEIESSIQVRGKATVSKRNRGTR